MALKIEYIPVGDLREYGRNARTHSVDQVAQIADSIREFGFTNPVLIDENNELIAGHGRTQAAISLGLNEVPAIRLEGLSDAQKRALRIADNQLALNAGWDLELLAEEVQGLDLEGFDMDLLGFSDEDLGSLLDGVMEGLQDTQRGVVVGADSPRAYGDGGLQRGGEDSPRAYGDGDAQGEMSSRPEEEKPNPYTMKVTTPIYEVKGDRPNVEDLYDDSRFMQLIKRIRDADIPEDIREFLTKAAYRHVVVNYEKVAEFYAHTKDENIRELFRDSALVIIDYGGAIERGYVKLTKKLMELSSQNDELEG